MTTVDFEFNICSLGYNITLYNDYSLYTDTFWSWWSKVARWCVKIYVFVNQIFTFVSKIPNENHTEVYISNQIG
jgi:hypothetical protein